MKWSEWCEQWRFERTVDGASFSLICSCPYAFVRVLWHYNRRPFQAWPSQHETGVVIGWRWPFARQFRERQWVEKRNMPLAVYGGPMDEVYLIRALDELEWPMEESRQYTQHPCSPHQPHGQCAAIATWAAPCDHRLLDCHVPAMRAPCAASRRSAQDQIRARPPD